MAYNFNSGNSDDHSREDVSATSDPSRAWVTEDELAALAEERETLAMTPEEQAEKILEENLIPSIHSLGKMARSAQSETVRMNAAKYIIDRNLGKITDAKPKEVTPLEDFLKSLNEAEEEAIEVARERLAEDAE